MNDKNELQPITVYLIPGDDGTISAETAFNTISQAVSFSGITCGLELKTKDSPKLNNNSIYVSYENKTMISMVVILNNVKERVWNLRLTALNISTVISRCILKIKDVEYLEKYLHLKYPYKSLKYGTSETKTRRGRRVRITTPFRNMLYCVNSIKTLEHLIMSEELILGLDYEKHFKGFPNVHMTTDGIHRICSEKEDVSDTDFYRLKIKINRSKENEIWISKKIHSLITPIDEELVYNLRVSGALLGGTFVSSKRYQFESHFLSAFLEYDRMFDGVSRNVGITYKTDRNGELGAVISHLEKEDRILGGVKKKFISMLEDYRDNY